MPRLTIVADRHIWEVKSAFSELPGYQVNLTTLERNEINAEAVRDADILLVRSGIKVGADLLAGSRIRFVATATVGDDHLDKPYMDNHGIAFATAAGSSTRSVVEYILASLLQLYREQCIDLPESRIGIIGAGRIGSSVIRVSKALGMNVLANDPPLARQGAKELTGLSDLLQRADILTLHTPLTRTGKDATYHLIGDDQLKTFNGRCIINAARGGVLHDEALLRWLNGKKGRYAVLDCWEHEPNISRELLSHPQMIIATPHIAGHSVDGKAANTQFVYDALCRFLAITPAWHMRQYLPEHKSGPEVISSAPSLMASIANACLSLYPIAEDHKRLRCSLDGNDDELAASFVRQRRHYPPRRQWDIKPVRFEKTEPQLMDIATAIGLRIM